METLHLSKPYRNFLYTLFKYFMDIKDFLNSILLLKQLPTMLFQRKIEDFKCISLSKTLTFMNLADNINQLLLRRNIRIKLHIHL